MKRSSASVSTSRRSREVNRSNASVADAMRSSPFVSEWWSGVLGGRIRVCAAPTPSGTKPIPARRRRLGDNRVAAAHGVRPAREVDPEENRTEPDSRTGRRLHQERRDSAEARVTDALTNDTGSRVVGRLRKRNGPGTQRVHVVRAASRPMAPSGCQVPRRAMVDEGAPRAPDASEGGEASTATGAPSTTIRRYRSRQRGGSIGLRGLLVLADGFRFRLAVAGLGLVATAAR